MDWILIFILLFIQDGIKTEQIERILLILMQHIINISFKIMITENENEKKSVPTLTLLLEIDKKIQYFTKLSRNHNK